MRNDDKPCEQDERDDIRRAVDSLLVDPRFICIVHNREDVCAHARGMIHDQRLVSHYLADEHLGAVTT